MTTPTLKQTYSPRLQRSGLPCTNCETAYDTCTDLVLDKGRACCRRCQYTDTHDEQRGGPMNETIVQRVADVLLAHLQVTQAQVPGAVVANPCLCGWGEWGHSHADHVAEKLREAGLLADEEAQK